MDESFWPLNFHDSRVNCRDIIGLTHFGCILATKLHEVFLAFVGELTVLGKFTASVIVCVSMKSKKRYFHNCKDLFMSLLFIDNLIILWSVVGWAKSSLIFFLISVCKLVEASAIPLLLQISHDFLKSMFHVCRIFLGCVSKHTVLPC